MNYRICHIAVIGHGAVGGEFIRQVISQRASLLDTKGLDLRIFAIANSQRLLLDTEPIGEDWEVRIAEAERVENLSIQITTFALQQDLQNLILVDNTASDIVARQYEMFVIHGFSIVSSNKRANTLPWSEYRSLRATLLSHHATYRYETNVGAGLPLIDNISLLHLSGERIRRILGVFSGSLSYIFNHLDKGTKAIREVIAEAIALGYAEPDPREDLSGQDVARKVLILARELDIELNLEDVEVENIVPTALRTLPYDEFITRIGELEDSLLERISRLGEGEVLRYVGEVSSDEQRQKVKLSAKLRAVPKDSILGRLQATDCCFQIYTESYGEYPIVIQGAGAGVRVTARGVFGDVLRLTEEY